MKEEIKLTEYQANKIKHALVMAIRTLKSRDRETAMDRQLLLAETYINEALKHKAEVAE